MDFDTQISQLAESLKKNTIKCRRDLHRHPESGWTEFRTACIVIKQLLSFGYDVKFGEDVLVNEECMGIPNDNILKENMQRAVSQGADPHLVEKMTGGHTGVVGIMDFATPGKTIALRFDMDCNAIIEAHEEKHRPFREGFSSINYGCMHACGHDGHTSVGLAVAEIIATLKENLSGKIKFIFQPAEEGVRGARGMAAKGIVDDVDYLLGAHLMKPKIGYLGYDVHGFLATNKFNADFTGVSAHAGSYPEKGKNALIAAANAAINIQAISRHSDGTTRVNVGMLNSGTERNVIPDNAHMEIETRGASSEVNNYMYSCAKRILKSCAQMYDVKVKITDEGSAASGNNSPEFSKFIYKIAKRLNIFNKLDTLQNIGGSEDCSYFMERVQAHGGQAAYLIIGASLTAINHNPYFDFDERALTLETILLSSIACELLKKRKE
ncbi:amidohydrolase [Pectinatus frisingensis]|uniref:amidohydrolase n=1 Tax=Pectinatus frisingensis TaxID=865 RepID=UPI0018C80870|nr:amidohydrolase [Pectinatus frisingensis]